MSCPDGLVEAFGPVDVHRIRRGRDGTLVAGSGQGERTPGSWWALSTQGRRVAAASLEDARDAARAAAAAWIRNHP